ncbi:PREDICTED: cilia- and flagella-associated protein 61 isoform X1 [Chinchilla lanigera]|uniref:cilia- and flagella-associated protein 61 isoform X1 n=1 Tax=Chinchilla lanigera TaxID=34839 RepID=UPI00069611C6|nr:PREDICTED: cilia- and flagella-associated protein 61 isoform X1 [Chinchilla lanigera]XP_013367640.1 PREDICTED: cilia- and flagella-associated protein 61 isoform X1 [Chinchilla lanigera]
MSVLTSPRGKAEVVHCRRTESQDIYYIKKLIRKFTQKLFGRLNVIYLLEKANLAITLCNDKEEIMAHAILLDYPNWNVARPEAWPSAFKELDSSIPCTPLNTLFLHLFVAVDEYSVGCCKEIIRTVFKAVPELHFIFLVVPSYMSLGSTLITVFNPVGSMPCLTYNEDFTVYICHRHRHYPQLYIRRARMEDHDDLMPIFMLHDTVLKDTYGEYFLAELIEAQDEENHAVVCEVEGVAVGFMSVCSRVNLPLLHECFDLGPFHGFCVPHPDDVLEPPKEPGIADAELRTDSQVSQRIAEEPLGPVSPEAMGSAQEKVMEEAEVLSAVHSENVSEIQDLDKLSLLSLTGEQEHGVSRWSSASIQLPKEPSHFRPVYRGAPSVFCIQLFCIDEKYEARSLDFMNFVFSLFPDKNFCIISVPQLTPEFVLIQNFMKVIPFNDCTLQHDLYVFHRAGLFKSINIRLANSADTPGVEQLVSSLMLSRSILEDLAQYNEARRDPDGTPLRAFVAEVAEQVVGIAVIRNETDIEYIRSHYNIEDFIYFSHHQRDEHGRLHHLAMNPAFRHYTKFFLKEILRLDSKTCLYYPVYPQPRDGKIAVFQLQSPYAHSLTSALHYLVPVRPRRQIVYPLEKLGINAPSKAVSKDALGYALNHTNRKLTLEPKITVNARIVVVGASSVGISFLETLVFCSHLKFNNLTLISTHGLPGKKLLGNEQRKFLASDHCFNDKDYALMSLCSWVNVVVGRMTGIDRAAKHVVVSKDKAVPYDHLILCTGQQYQVPCPTGADISQHPTNREVPDSSKIRYSGQIPCNLFMLNDEEDCVKALTWIRSNSIVTEGNVIVYGNTIDTYTTVETLLSLGVRGSCIYLVCTPPKSMVPCINNHAVESAVEEALQAAGVTTFRDAILAQWNQGLHPDPIHCASFTTPTKPFQLQCAMFFSFCEKNVDYETFKALNDACLVYDGRLVIDTNFHTNDIAIRAAGPLTKFSNRYYANDWTHSNFSSKEVGFQLAATMLNLFDPTLEPVIEPPADLDRLIPMYKGAKIQGGILPGSYHYLHITKPAITTPLEVQKAQSDFGSEIVTGCAKSGTYFRIHINKYEMVEDITCLSHEPFPVSNYIRLFGQHEQALNDLCARYNSDRITDLYSYFTEPWCMALLHDRFIDLRKELRQVLASEQEEGRPSIEQLARQIEEEEISLKEPRKYLRKVFQETIYRPLVEKSILDYLHYNRYHLPMYAWPGII